MRGRRAREAKTGMETGKEMARETEGNKNMRWRCRQKWDRDTEKHKDRARTKAYSEIRKGQRQKK